MVGFLWTAIKLAVNAVVKFLTGIFGEWLRLWESRKLGRMEAKNDALKDAAKRKERSDKILQEPVKKGDELIDSIRERNKSLRD